MAPQTTEINFGSLGFYSGASIIPPGRYCLQFNTCMNSGKQGNQKPRLGVNINFLPLDDPQPDKALDQFYSMGSKADQNFAPNSTGKGLAKVPGAAGTSLQENTNWQIFLKSLYDCGLPEGVFSNDLSVLDGVWVTVDSVKEPDERKSYRQSSATATAIAGVVGGAGVADPAQAGFDQNRTNMIAVVTEIIEGGAPWEGGGGIPEAPKGKAKAAPKAAAKPVPVAAPKAAAKVPPPPPAAAAEEDLNIPDIASNALTNALMGKKTLSLAKLRMAVFNGVTKSHNEETAATVVSDILDDASMFSTVLGELGYGVVGANVVLV